MLAPRTKIVLTQIGAFLTGMFLIEAASGLYSDFYALDISISIGFLVLALLAFAMGYRNVGLGGIGLMAVFNPLVPIHLSRNLWVIIDLLALAGMIYFVYWATNPYKKGTRFEQYISTLFPEPNFIIEDRTRDVSKFLGRLVESDMHPDFVFRNQRTGKQFAIECKWRARWAQGNNGDRGIRWDTAQGERYGSFKKSSGMDVFVVFGIGGTPEKPAEHYFLELEKLQHRFLTQSFVRSQQVDLLNVGQ